MRLAGVARAVGLAALVAACSPTPPAAAQTRADTLAILRAVLVETSGREKSQVFVSTDAEDLLREAHAALAGVEVAPDRRVVCPLPGGPPDSGAYRVGVSVRPPPPPSPTADPEIAALLGSPSPPFRADSASADVSVGTSCWRRGVGGGGVTNTGPDGTFTFFGAQSLYMLKRVDGVWTVTGRRFISIS